ncbi:MAG: oligosaccharide flippase family protein [bacterium]
MISKIKCTLKDPALTGTLIVSMGVFLGSIFSYLLQIGLGHLLSIEDFGLFNAFLSLSVIFGIPAGAVSVSLVKKVAEHLARNDFKTLRTLFWSLSKSSLGFGICLSLLFVIFKSEIAAYLNIPQNGVIFMFAVFLALSFINVAPLAYLQGLLRFKAYAFLSFISQLLRLVIPLGLVYAGFAVKGAYAGLILVGLLSYGVAILLLNKNLKMGVDPENNRMDEYIRAIYRKLLIFSIPVLFINSGVAILNNLDIVMVKHFFSPYEAGVYAGVVTICKVFLFGASIVQIVMFPQISHLYAANANYKKRFFKFLALQLLLIFGGLFVFSTLPSLINQLMFGGKFADSVPYLPLFALFTAFYILLTFLSMFLLAINKTKAYLIILPAVLLQYLAISAWHTNLFSIIRINIISAGVACLLIVMYVVKSLHESVGNCPHLQTGKNH